MKLPFTIERLVTTKLSFDQIIQELENKSSIKSFGGLRIDKYQFNQNDNVFYVQRYSNGIDAFLEYFPLIKGQVVNDDPLRIYLTLKPSYFTILFFSVFALSFLIGGVFIDEWTLNGVKRPPSIIERFLIVLLGSGIPILWCYLQYIRPIKKTENWIFEKLFLVDCP